MRLWNALRSMAAGLSTAAIVVGGTSSSALSSGEVPVGASRLVFDEAGYDPLPVWTYRPERLSADDPVLVVMHGAKRNADVYRDAWIDAAERLGVMLLVPEFSKAGYPAGWAYQQVGALGPNGALRPAERWAASRVERLFDYVVAANGLHAQRYYFYGHSAGGQFVHRTMLLMPDARVELAVPANAGWYTLPDLELTYPEGLADTPAGADSLRRSLQREVVVLLGDADTDPDHKSLPQQPAARRQGPHRFARGELFIERARSAADQLGVDLRWKVRVAPGVTHSNKEMAPFAAEVIAEHIERAAARTAGEDPTTSTR